MNPLSDPLGTQSVNAFAPLSVDDVRLCCALGERASKMVGQWVRDRRPDLPDPHPMILSMDFAIAHAFVPMHLMRLLMCDDLTFSAELAKILQGINRPLQVFNSGVKLAFAVNPN